jgi:hypothetical protein
VNPVEALDPDLREALGLEAEAPAREDLDGLLRDIEAYIARYVYFPSPEQVVPLVLFVPVCYALLEDGTAVPAAPYISVTSPAPECGKSRLLEVLHKLLGDERALFVAGSMTPATLYRSREEHPIVLLVDEVGRLFGRRDDVARELVAILDSGYRRGATVPRAVPVGKDFVVRRWPVFGPAVLAGLGDIADTTRSRCIPIVLQRRPRHVQVSPFFEDEAEPAAAAIRARLEAAAPALATALRARRPDITALGGLRDRTIETWRGLLAVAELAGGDWPARARAAALALHAGGDAAELDRGTALLQALREVFDEAGTDRLPTAQVLEALVEREGEPWPARWGQEVEAARDRGRPARRAASELARMLKGFGIKPAVIKMPDGSTPRGYRREHLEPAWAAYLGDSHGNATAGEGGDATDATNATALASEVASVALVASGAPDGGDFPRNETPTGCPSCGARSAAPGYRGHAMSCPRFYGGGAG